MSKVMHRLFDIDMNDVLGAVGLQRRRSSIAPLLPIAGALLFGAAIGAGVMLAMPPVRTHQLRRKVIERAERLRGTMARARALNHFNASPARAIEDSVSSHS